MVKMKIRAGKVIVEIPVKIIDGFRCADISHVSAISGTSKTDITPEQEFSNMSKMLVAIEDEGEVSGNCAGSPIEVAQKCGDDPIGDGVADALESGLLFLPKLIEALHVEGDDVIIV